MKKRGQVTIFIILAIVIVAGIVFFFAMDFSFTKSIPSDMRPVYDYYLSCLENEAYAGVTVMGEQGGYIKTPEFVAGSSYSPTSSQLDFFGRGVPYWIYLTGNNILKEQVPTIDSMEKELGEYLEEKLISCDFSDFEKAGFAVYMEEGDVSSKINKENIEFKIDSRITIYKGDNSVIIDGHDFKMKSKLGKFYDMSLEVLDAEKKEAFLEKYAIDVMRLYAPVDGVEFSCVPQIFIESEIREDITLGLEANINSIKLDGDYYDLANEERKYFVADLGIKLDESANFMYNRNWPTRIEIYGDMVANPVGTQPGLSALGMCFVPYHLVYDMNFPVMVQFYDEDNFFQFPISVIIDNNQAREAVNSTTIGIGKESEVCKYNNADLEVYTYDSELNPVPATLSFKCLDAICEIGETEIDDSVAKFEGLAPSCVNAFIVASAEGYTQSKYQISTNSEHSANILLNKKYNLPISFEGVQDRMAVVTFTGEDYSATVVYPEMDSIELVEGSYDVKVYVYENSVLKFPATTDVMCVDVPVSGAGALFGLEEEKCYDINTPEMEIEMAVVGGGSGSEYVAESMLRNSKKLNINVEFFDKPVSLDALQENYASVENAKLYLEFE